MIFLDPELPPRLEGLQAGACVDCGGRALVDAEYAGVVRCSACWARVHGVGASGTLGRRRDRRYPGGRAPGPSPVVATMDQVGGNQPRTLPRRTHRVLVPAPPSRVTPDATPSQIPTGAASLRLVAEAAGHAVRVTYALAEELATGKLVASAVVRIGAPMLGYGAWLNGEAAGGRWAGVPRALGVRELEHLVRGEPYVPPAPRPPAIKGPCPRCGAEVRWRVDAKKGPVTWKHNRAAGAEGTRSEKVECTP